MNRRLGQGTWDVLRYVMDDGGAVLTGEVAKDLGITTHDANAALAKLEARGLVIKRLSKVRLGRQRATYSVASWRLAVRKG